VEVITDLLPVKRGDPGRLIIPISIGMVDFPEALYDFDSSVNIMPRGILKNLYVRVGTLYAPADFVVIETDTDERAPIILGRPFLNTVKAIIYIGTREVHLHFPSEKVRRYVTDPNYMVEDSKQVGTRRRRHNHNQRRQIIKDRWADYEEEVVMSEDIQLEQNCPKETVAPSQVCREKIVIHEEEAPPELPTTPCSESQDD